MNTSMIAAVAKIGQARILLVLFGLLAAVPPAKADCPAGRDQCLPGFVWREAFPGDHVCVTRTTHKETLSDNANAAMRQISGSTTCIQGFVWREAEPDDFVCVLPPTRTLAAADNQAANARRDATCEADRVDPSINVLTLNLFGTNPVEGVPFEKRVRRVALWAARNRIIPDLIVLQELFGWLATPILRSCGRGWGVNVGDYDAIDILLSELKSLTGITYRVAYLTGREGTYGFPIQCSVYHAQSILYNPSRLVNKTQNDSGSVPHNLEQGVVNVPHLRRSLPLCNRGTHLMPLEDLIDGPPQTDKCNRPTPSGPAYAVFTNAGHIAATFSEFEFAAGALGPRRLAVFNMHPTDGMVATDLVAIKALLDSKLPPPHSRLPNLLFPPILAGDFNGLEIEGSFPRFASSSNLDTDVMSMGIGNQNEFATLYQPLASLALIVPDLPPGGLCGGENTNTMPNHLISDHCGLFVRYSLDGPQAGALRKVFVDGPHGVREGAAYQLQATPSGAGPNYEYRWQPGGSRSAVVSATAGPANVPMNWRVEVKDVFSGQVRTATHIVNVVAAPEPPDCKKGCADERDKCVAESRNPGAPSVKECVRLYGECLATCVSQ